MKKLVVLSMMLMATVCSFAHRGTTTTTVVSNDTLYYDSQMHKVMDREGAAYYRLFARETGENIQRDVFQDFYLNGKMRAQGGYSFLDLTNDKNTVLDGSVVTYYSNGMEKWRCNYKNGKRDGYLTLQLRDGGVAVVLYANGQPLRDYVTVTHKDGKMERKSFDSFKSLLQ